LVDDPLFPAFIAAYRKNIRDKYNWTFLSRDATVRTIGEEKVEQMLAYFLELLYPELEERKRLDQAFQSLSGFIHQPAKVWGLLGSIGLSLWKIGKYLPQAFRAGMAALSAYVTAHSFEGILIEGIREHKFTESELLQESNFKKLLARIPKSEADEFRKDTVSLFATLSQDELVDRILEILASILGKMKEKTNLYTPQDREGIQLGRDILLKGRAILKGLSLNERNVMLQTIERVEREYFESCIRNSVLEL
jgi:hypothetical protein